MEGKREEVNDRYSSQETAARNLLLRRGNSGGVVKEKTYVLVPLPRGSITWGHGGHKKDSGGKI